MLLFDKNCHILILTKKEVFFFKDTNYFTLPNQEVGIASLPLITTLGRQFAHISDSVKTVDLSFTVILS